MPLCSRRDAAEIAQEGGWNGSVCQSRNQSRACGFRRRKARGGGWAENRHFQSRGGHYYVIENTCPHRGGPLAEGMVAGDEVICPWHGSRFNIKTGAVLSPPAREGVKSFAVRVTEHDVEVEIG